MEFIRILLIGICVGMANVIPGVSGGTIAVVFNIYDRLVSAITLNVKKLIENWKFVVPVLCGMLLGILIFSKLITVLYEHFSVQTDYFFTGLILGSLPMLFGYMLKKNDSEKKPSFLNVCGLVICVLAGVAVMLAFIALEKRFGGDSELIFALPEISAALAARIFVAGVLGAVAMIVPGISGSLLMLILGVYPIIIASIPALFNPDTFLHAFLLLLPNGIGVLTGLLAGAKLISWLIKKTPNHTYAVIFGLICGSLIKMFPGFSGISGVPAAITCVLCLLFGAALAYFSAKFTKD